jgi:CRP-like cAMP-binding protein
MPNQDFFRYQAPAAPAPVMPLAALPTPPAAPRPILADLDDDDWERFIGFAARRRYPDGATIVAAGAHEPAIGFVASGAIELQLERAGAVAGPPAVRGEGEAFGLLNFLDGGPSQVSVRARGAAEVLLFGRDAFEQLAAWQPRIALALLRDLGANLAGRLRRLQPAD